MRSNKKVNTLVSLSYTKGKLDAGKIGVIAKTLTGRDLLRYYEILSSLRENEKVFITAAIEMPKNMASRFSKIFENSDVFFQKDDSILGGLKVQIGDLVFNASIADYLKRIKKDYEAN